MALEDFRDNAQSFVGVLPWRGSFRASARCANACKVCADFSKDPLKTRENSVLGRLFEVPLTGGEFFDIISKDGAVPKW